MSMLKHVLAFFAFLALSLAPVYADEGYIPYFPDFLEPDGIKYAVGQKVSELRFESPPFNNAERYLFKTARYQMFTGDNEANQQGFSIVLPETLMSSWSFRGAYIVYTEPLESKNLIPANGEEKEEVSKDGESRTFLRQFPADREWLINNFFNSEDKDYIAGKNNWALSGDYQLQQTSLGYYWGLFIPLGKKHRLLKAGFGLNAAYLNANITLYLCEKYISSDGNGYGNEGHGDCVGKKEIDSSSINTFLIGNVIHITFWERFSENSIWRIFSQTIASIRSINYKLKNHKNSLNIDLQAEQLEFISYTYRF